MLIQALGSSRSLAATGEFVDFFPRGALDVCPRFALINLWDSVNDSVTNHTGFPDSYRWL